MKVKAPNAADQLYLTPGKVYDAKPFGKYAKSLARVIDDQGHELIISIYGCAHCEGQAWEVVE